MTSIVNVNVTQTGAPIPPTLQSTGALVSQGATILSPQVSSLLTQFDDLTPLLAGAKPLTTLTWSGSVATATATNPHGFTVDDTLLLTIAGAVPAGYNGTFLCTITSTTAFTYALASNPGASTSQGIYTPEDVVELIAMATTFFSQGNNLSVWVLELGAGNASDGVAELTSYINENPNRNYTPGATGFFYAYLVPRYWDGNSDFLAFLNTFNATTARTYFHVTTTLASYTAYTVLMKCVLATIECPQFGVYPQNALSAASWTSSVVTATTTTAHGVVPGDYFTILGMTPAGYNGTFLALPGTTASTLLYALAANPGAESALGTLEASRFASTGIPATEFSAAADFYRTLNQQPSPTQKVPPNAFAAVTAVTPFPVRGTNSLQQTLKDAKVNIIGTGAEGGLTETIVLWGTTMDGRDFLYWYAVDWVQINSKIDLANEVINGSNDNINPLYFDQPGINRLQVREQSTMDRGVTYGLVLSPVTVIAVPFLTYVKTNPDDYPEGIYNGLACTFTPQTGFKSITFNVDVAQLPVSQ